MIAKKIRDFLPEADLLSYVEAILRVYNLYGRRDNKYKARIKILVHETGVEEIRAPGRGRVRSASSDGALTLPEDEIRAHRRLFRAAGVRAAAGRATRRSSARGCRSGASPTGSTQNVDAAPHPGLRHRHGLAEADRRHAGRRHRRPDGRWSPTSPSATASTRCASATSRT